MEKKLATEAPPYTVSAAPAHIRAYRRSPRALYFNHGLHVVCDGHVHLARPGGNQAQEVLASGSAQLTLRGHIMAKLWGRSHATAGEDASVELREQSSLAIKGGFVIARDQSSVDALTSYIHVTAGTPTIKARACMIIVDPDAKPVLDGDTDCRVFYGAKTAAKVPVVSLDARV